MEFRLFFVTLAILGLVSCAQFDPHPMDMTSAIQNAKTREDHDALASHYEAVAHDMRLRAQEHKKELEYYDMHPYYGTRTQDLKAHCRKLISSYEQAAETNMSMAKAHRQMAEEAK